MPTIFMKQYFDRPLTLGVVIFSTRIRLKMVLSDSRKSSSLALNSKFPTYSVAVVLLPMGLRCTAGRTWSRAALDLALAASYPSSGI